MTAKSTRKVAVVTMIVLAGVLSSALLFHLTARGEKHALQHEFLNLASDRAKAIQDHLEDNVEALRSIGSFYAASEDVDHNEFRIFTKPLFDIYPSILELRWQPRIKKAERPSFEEETRRQGFADYAIREWNKEKSGFVVAGDRDEYFPVLHTELSPQHAIDRKLILGLDTASFPERWQKMQRARDTGEIAMTGELVYVGEIGENIETATRMFLPIYRNGEPHGTLDEKRRNHSGFVTEIFRTDEVVERSLRGLPVTGIDLYLFESEQEKPKDLVYFRPSKTHKNRPEPIRTYAELQRKNPFLFESFTIPLTIDRQLTVVCVPAPFFWENHRPWASWLVLCFGIFSTGVIAAYFNYLTRRTAIVESLVNERAFLLKKSEEQVRLLLNSTAEALYGIDLQGNCTFANPSCLKMLGYTNPKQLLGKNMHRLIHYAYPDKRPMPVEVCKIYRAFREGKAVHVDDEVLWKADGTRFFAEYWSHPQITDGKVSGAVVTFIDISERRTADEKIRKLSRAVEQSPASIVITDKHGNIEYVNRKFIELTGYKAEEALGKNPRVLKSGEQSREYYKELWDTLIAGREWRGEFHNKKKNGELYWEFASISPLKNDREEITHFIAVKEDITERKKIEAALEESRHFLDQIINSVGDPIFVKDREHRWILLNEAFCRLMGHPREKLLGKSDYDFFPKEEADVFWAKDEEVFKSGRENINEEKFTDAQGVSHSILTKKILYTDENRQGYLVGVIVDITPLKKIQDELGRSNKELEQFAYVASHDLQEPLRKITTFSQLLREKKPANLDDEAKDYLTRMCSAAERMSRLISDLLDYSRVTTREKTREKVDLKRAVDEVLGDLEVRIRESQARIEISSLPTVTFDPLFARQLFQNLIGNALKFQKKDTPLVIQIASRETERYYEISVEDNGIGFDMKYAERIFGTFQRLHTREEYEGSGIGLAICKKIIQQMGGEIDVRSRPGMGSTFTVKLLK